MRKITTKHDIPAATCYVTFTDTLIEGRCVLPCSSFVEAAALSRCLRKAADAANVYTIDHKPRLHSHVLWVMRTRRTDPHWFLALEQ